MLCGKIITQTSESIIVFTVSFQSHKAMSSTKPESVDSVSANRLWEPADPIESGRRRPDLPLCAKDGSPIA